MWVVSCVTARVTWASPPGRRRRSVHKSVKMASRRRFGAFVYTVGPWAWVVGGLGIAIVYTNGRIGPLLTGLGRLCTLLGGCAVVDRRGDAIVYTDRRKRPLGAVLGHLCTLLRREDRASRRWGRRSVHRLARMASRCRFGAFVYTVASRVTIRIATRSAQGGTSASATMACRRRPLAGPLAWSGRQALREWRRC